MKKRIILAFMSLFLAFGLNAQIYISGMLLNSNPGGGPIPFENITISANGTVLGTVMTSNSGSFFYADSSYSCGFASTIEFSAIDCNGNLVSWTETCNNYMQVTLSMCGGGTSYCDAAFSYALQPTGAIWVAFSDLSTASSSILSWQWSFGDGTTSYDQNPMHMYNAFGVYTVCLTILTADSCTSTFCDSVMVGTASYCNADFVAYPDSFNLLSYYFYDLSSATANISNWYWEFGDSTFSTLQNPTHNYAYAGAYNVCLTITTTDGCTSSSCQTIFVDTIITPNCNANFTYSQTGGMLNSYYFSNLSYPYQAQYMWDFGDGTSSTLQNPTHSFSPGVYTVCLTMYSSNCTDTYCETIIVDTLNSYCNADFGYYQNPMAGGTVVNFWDYSSASSQILEWYWDFGDGSTATGSSQTYTYSNPGVYLVCLTIMTLDSCTSTYCDSVAVNIITPTCNANFYYTSAGSNLTYNFWDYSYPSPTSWSWDFDDGTTDSISDPTHTFPGPGTYNVCLTIYTSAGCTDTYCEALTIDSIINCEADFTYALDSSSSVPNTLMFTDLSNSTGTISSWSWDFGDGNSSTDQNPTHSYAANGNYTVSLTITTSDGCSSTKDMVIVIGGTGVTYQISGFVTGDSMYVNTGMVMLFGGGSMYTATIDSGYYLFTGLPADNYIVYAIPDFISYPNLIPTYYGNTIFWGTATEIVLNADFNYADIDCDSYNTVLSGPGVIGGILFFNNTKASSDDYYRKLNESIEDISIMLMDIEDNVLFHILTDASGHFVFEDLPYGTYKLYVELTGYDTYPAIITLDENNYIVDDIDVVISGNSIIIGTEEPIQFSDIITTYPNPVKDILNIELQYNHTDLQLNIYNAVGQRVYTDMINASENTKQLNVNDLTKGVYYLRVSNESSEFTTKFIK